MFSQALSFYYENSFNWLEIFLAANGIFCLTKNLPRLQIIDGSINIGFISIYFCYGYKKYTELRENIVNKQVVKGLNDVANEIGPICRAEVIAAINRKKE